MRALITLLAACLLAGCKTQPPSQLAPSDHLHEQAIHAILKKAPVPAPRNTPYDSDERQRQAFTDGFRTGWDQAISGALLHGTFAAPVDLADDLRTAWTRGWCSGIGAGIDRWQAESRKARLEPIQAHGARN